MSERRLPKLSAKLVFAMVLCSLLHTASAYELMGLKWPTNSMQFNYDFELKGSSISPSGANWNQAFEDAARGWNRQTNFTILMDDTRPSHPCAGVGSFPGDGLKNGAAFHHELCFLGQDERVEAFGDRVLAVTILYSYTDAPGETIEADMFFNTGEGWDVYDGALRSLFDFERIAKHEMGHGLGLDHEQREVALMAPKVSNLYTLQADDIAGAAALYGSSNIRQPIALAIEEPFNGAVQSGISTFRGWVVSVSELSSLKLYLNGQYKGELDHSGPRGDVCNVYGDYPNCAKSGFAFAYAYGILPEGNSTYRVVARDVLGNELSKAVTFQVTRFDDAYVADPNRVTLADAAVSLDKAAEQVIINNLTHNGKKYKLLLKWKTQSQSFEPMDIIRK